MNGIYEIGISDDTTKPFITVACQELKGKSLSGAEDGKARAGRLFQSQYHKKAKDLNTFHENNSYGPGCHFARQEWASLL